jgi:hypothetical protein
MSEARVTTTGVREPRRRIAQRRIAQCRIAQCRIGRSGMAGDRRSA